MKWTSDMIDLRVNIEYWIQRSMRYFYSFQNVFENLKIPYKQLQLVHLYSICVGRVEKKWYRI